MPPPNLGPIVQPILLSFPKSKMALRLTSLFLRANQSIQNSKPNSRTNRKTALSLACTAPSRQRRVGEVLLVLAWEERVILIWRVGWLARGRVDSRVVRRLVERRLEREGLGGDSILVRMLNGLEWTSLKRAILYGNIVPRSNYGVQGKTVTQIRR